eukprot:gene7696-8533_t
MANRLGCVTVEDSLNVNQAISCMFKIALYALLDDELYDCLAAPERVINKNTMPQRHMFYPLAKKHLWLGYSCAFKVLDSNLLRMILNRKGNSQLIDIITNMLQEKHPGSTSCFWSLLFILYSVMKKLGSMFWLLMGSEESPESLFRLIVEHREFKTCLRSLQAKESDSGGNSKTAKNLDSDDDVFNTLLLNYYSSTGDLTASSRSKTSLDPFFWVMPFVTTVLDLEDIAGKVINVTMKYLVTKAKEGQNVGALGSTELDYRVLNCLINVLKYVLEKRVAYFIQDAVSSWFDLLCHVLFRMKLELKLGSKKKSAMRWSDLWQNARSVLVVILAQGEECDTQTGHEYRHSLYSWLNGLKLNTPINYTKLGILKKSFAEIFNSVTEVNLSEFCKKNDGSACFARDEDKFMNVTSSTSAREFEDDEKINLHKPGYSSLAPITLDSGSDSDDMVTGDPIISKGNAFTKSFAKVLPNSVSFNGDSNSCDFNLHFSNSDASDGGLDSSSAVEAMAVEIDSDGKRKELGQKESKNHSIVIDDDSDTHNSEGEDVSESKCDKKRKCSNFNDADECADTQQQRKKYPKIDSSHSGLGQGLDRNDHLQAFEMEKYKSESSTTETSERGIFDFLGKIKATKVPVNEERNAARDQIQIQHAPFHDDVVDDDINDDDVKRYESEIVTDTCNNDIPKTRDKSSPNKQQNHDGRGRNGAVKDSSVFDELNEAGSSHISFGLKESQEREAVTSLSSSKFQLDTKVIYEKFVKRKNELMSTECDNNTQQSVDSFDVKPNGDHSKVESTTGLASASVTDVSSTQTKASTAVPQCLPEIRKHKLYNINSLLQYILSWQPMWLKNEQENELEIMLPCDPQMVKSKYNSYDDYMMTMWPLVLIEFFAQMIKDFKENENQILQCKLKSVEQDVDSQYFSIVNFACLQEYSTISRNFRHPREEDLVIVRCVDEYTTEIFGVITEVEKTELDTRGSYNLLELQIKVARLPPQLDISSAQIQIVTSLVSLLRRWEALIFLPKSLIAGDILNPFRPQVFEAQENANHATYGNYNPSQSKAIATITDAVMQAFPLPKLRLLQGPPGTGKTHTLKGLIKNVLQLLPADEKPRILICAPSNAAVDEIASRLLEDPPKLSSNAKASSRKPPSHNNCGNFNLLRIGSNSNISRRIGKCTLDYLVGNEINKLKLFSNPDAIREEIKKIAQNLNELDKICTKLKMAKDKIKHAEWKRRMQERERIQRTYESLQKRLKMSASMKRDIRGEEHRLRRDYLIKADIICCTLHGAGSKHMIKTFKSEWNGSNGTPFTCVIIDEAGQCCEPEALIPLQYGSSKLVLIGDPAQLPATRAFRYNYGQSLFERVQNNLLEHYDTPVLMLEEQYRMLPAISEFPSQKFYNGRLSTAREVLEKETLRGIRPFCVLNIRHGMEVKEPKGMIHNPEERKFVIHLIQEIRRKEITSMGKVGVITPYRKQINIIKEELPQGSAMKGLEIDTIDGFQGREKDIIILSCVRACAGQSCIGFLRDPQRLNVALTRAKHSLIVLLHVESLQVDEDWKDLIDFSRSRNLLFDVASVQDIDKAVFHLNKQTEGETSASAADKEENAEKTDSRMGKPSSCGKDLNVSEANVIEKNGVSTTQQKSSYDCVSSEVALNKVASEKATTCRPNTDSVGVTTGAKQDTDITKYDPKINIKIARNAEANSTSHKAAVNAKARVKFPHRHTDGTKCVERYKKTGERAGPSDAYYKLPHIHSDGLRCVDKCIRVEEREKMRMSSKDGHVQQSSAVKSGVEMNKQHVDPGRLAPEPVAQKEASHKSVVHKPVTKDHMALNSRVKHMHEVSITKPAVSCGGNEGSESSTDCNAAYESVSGVHELVSSKVQSITSCGSDEDSIQSSDSHESARNGTIVMPDKLQNSGLRVTTSNDAICSTAFQSQAESCLKTGSEYQSESNKVKSQDVGPSPLMPLSWLPNIGVHEIVPSGLQKVSMETAPLLLPPVTATDGTNSDNVTAENQTNMIANSSDGSLEVVDMETCSDVSSSSPSSFEDACITGTSDARRISFGDRSDYLTDNTYQPKVVLNRCSLDGCSDPASNPNVLHRYWSNERSCENPSSSMSCANWSSVPHAHQNANTDVTNATTVATITGLGVLSRNSSRPNSPCSFASSAATIDDEIHKIRLSTQHCGSESVHPLTAIDIQTPAGLRGQSPGSIEAPSLLVNIHPERRRSVIQGNFSARKDKSNDLPLNDNMRHRLDNRVGVMNSSGGKMSGTAGTMRYGNAFEFDGIESRAHDTQPGMKANVSRKKSKRIVRTGAMLHNINNDTNNNNNSKCVPAQHSNMAENLGRGFEESINTDWRHGTGRHQYKTNNVVRTGSYAGPNTNPLCNGFQYSDMFNVNQFDFEPNRFVPISSQSSRSHTNSPNLQRVEQITQRIRQRNLSRNKRTELISPVDHSMHHATFTRRRKRRSGRRQQPAM